VWAAKMDETKVCVKILKVEIANFHHEIIQEFEREASFLQRINHR
jgi:hypothetical protein